MCWRRCRSLVLVSLYLLHGLYAGQRVRAQQGMNNLWLMGFDSDAGVPWGGTNIDFITGAADIYYQYRAIGFKRASANISNSDGELLFSTNGAFIANASGDTLLNGTGLNPSWYTSQYPGGHHISQACLILPKPDVPSMYYLLHGTIDNPPGPNADFLYLSTIDMALDGGLGGVVSKNQVLIADALNTGRITAVRHANGRDWWAFCHKVNSNTFYRLLVTPQGVSLDGMQSIGITRPPDNGQATFSPDGSKFAYYCGFTEDLEVFGFDRCTGLFSNPVHIPINDANSMGGVAFSPNSRYLYVSSLEDVYQYDTEAQDIAASVAHIAEWDGFYSPGPPFATLFDIAQLAPDGKIYIATGNGTDKLHVINDPDEPGMACDIQQHAITLPTYNTNSLPNHPNYHLGPVVGSVCDSLDLGTGMATQQVLLGVQVYPNPSNGQFNLSYPVQPEAGLLEVLDMQGRVVYQSRLAAWSQVHRVALGGEAAGMYQCRLRWGARSISTRIIVTEP